MAVSKTLQVGGVYPAGSSVSVFQGTLPDSSITGGYPGTALQTVSVGASGTVTFTLLEAAKSYVISGHNHDGDWENIEFRTDVASGGLTIDDTGLLSDESDSVVLASALSATNVRVIQEAPLNVKYAEYGATGLGVVDDSAALQAALNAMSSSGGEMFIPPGTYLLSSQLTPPNDGSSPYAKQPSIRITGAGPSPDGQAQPVNGGTILDMRTTNVSGGIFTRGLGSLEIDHLTFKNGGTANAPFVYTTGTTVRIRHCHFQGDGAKAHTSCDQDAIILGGDTTTVAGTYHDPFQGYGSSIHDCSFNHIRRGAYLRVYCNGVTVRDNWIEHTCGSNLAGGTPFEIAGHSSNSSSGNLITGNTIEMLGYVYGIKADYAIGNVFLANAVYDPGNGTGDQASSSAAHRMEASAQNNLIAPGYVGTPLAALSEHATSAGTNRLITAESNGVELFQHGIRIGSGASNVLIDNGNGRLSTNARIEMAGLAIDAGQFIAPAGGAPVLDKRMRVYDKDGNQMGWIPVYSSI